MLYGPMTHPQFLRALAAAGHGSKILLADANYPHTTGVNPRCELISLNLAPGLLNVSQVLDVLKRTIPIERAEIMTPAPDADPVEIPIHDEFRAALPGVEFGEISRWEDVYKRQSLATSTTARWFVMRASFSSAST